MASLCHQFRARGRAISMTRGPKERTAPRCYLTALLIIQQWEKCSQIGLISLYIKQESRYKDRREGCGMDWRNSLYVIALFCPCFFFFFKNCTAKVGFRSSVIREPLYSVTILVLVIIGISLFVDMGLTNIVILFVKKAQYIKKHLFCPILVFIITIIASVEVLFLNHWYGIIC